MTRQEWENKLTESGYIDDRKLFTITNIKAAPNGMFGMVFMAIKNNTLTVYDTDMQGSVKGRLFDIDLDKISDVKINTMPLVWKLSFNYGGFRYKFSAGFVKGAPISEYFRGRQ